MTESIDLIAANPQVVLRSNVNHYTTIPDCLKRAMPPEETAMFDKLRRPVREFRGAVHVFLPDEIWSRFHHEFRWLADHEQVAHGSCERVVHRHGAILLILRVRGFLCSAVPTTWKMNRIMEMKRMGKR